MGGIKKDWMANPSSVKNVILNQMSCFVFCWFVCFKENQYVHIIKVLEKDFQFVSRKYADIAYF